jgi:formylglycine-generating enzyme required for sulfatase activity
VVVSALALVGVLLAMGQVLPPELFAAPVPTGLRPGDTREFMIAAGVKMVFCWIPPGTAQLGSPEAEQDFLTRTEFEGKRPEWLDGENETARGVYRSKGFWLGKYEVTQGEWVGVMNGPNPSDFDGAKDNKAKGMVTTWFPVERVSWDGCQGFLKALNDRSGAAGVFGGAGRFVLPNEDEWEYAYRGGKGNGRAFYWGDSLNGTEANCDGNYPYGGAAKGSYLERPAEVGSYESKSPHPWGLCDMAGNVWEWYDNKYKQSEDRRVLRGGSWLNLARVCRATYRVSSPPDRRDEDYGFRVCFRLD